jgi:hypothetical protein
VAYHYTDIFEAYTRDGKLLFRLHGPEKFDPSYETLGPYQNQRMVINRKTLTAYLAVCADKRYVYLLYSGQNSLPAKEPSKFVKYQRIYLFHKDGTPFKMYILNVTADANEMLLDTVHNKMYLGFYSERTGQSIYSVSTKKI